MKREAMVLTLLVIGTLSTVVGASFSYLAPINPPASPLDLAPTPTLSPTPLPASTASTNSTTSPAPPYTPGETQNISTPEVHAPVTPFSFDEINAMIEIQMPGHDGAYVGALTFNVSIEFYNNSPTKLSRAVPYQNITCIYSVDNGEWKNASFNALTDSKKCPSLANGGYWYEEFCTYGAVAQGLSEGLHFINVTVTPSEVHSHDSYSLGSDSSLYFTVHGGDVFSCRITYPIISTVSFPTTSVPLEYMLNAEASWVAYSLDGQANVTLNGETSMAVLTNGRHSVTVYANDTSGVMTRSNTVYFLVKSNSTISTSS